MEHSVQSPKIMRSSIYVDWIINFIFGAAGEQAIKY